MKNSILILLSFLGLNELSLAQNNVSAPDIKYRRSSLHTILVESDSFPRKETVIKAYKNAPFPDKYNDHTIAAKTFNPKKYALTEVEKIALQKKPAKSGGLFGNLISGNSSNEPNEEGAEQMPLIIAKFFKEEKIANQLVAKWFNRQADGSFNMDLVGERGSYNASEMEAGIAKSSARGTAALADAGEELIKNTFVVVSRLRFVKNEPIAALTRDIAISTADSMPNSPMKELLIKSANLMYEKTKDGYSVWTTSYLYQLEWNDSIVAVFYNDLWMDKDHLDPKKKAAFDNSDLFHLEFVGDEKARNLVLLSLKESRTEEQIIERATIRNIDAVYAKLQKKYDVFKPKVPLYTGYPITAKIGKKEGLEGGEKFVVLEQTVDPKTGITKYVSKGKITVDKDLIWDNEYNVGDGPKVQDSTTVAGGEVKPVIDRTTFKGAKDYYPGMLIKQIK